MASQKDQTQRPILIVDKIGYIGARIASEISKNSLVVFVSQNPPQLEKIIVVPFKNRHPSIPDNSYSCIIVIDDATGIRLALEKFVEKARLDDADLILISQLEKNSRAFLEESATYYKRAKILFYQDLLTDDELPSLPNELIKSIKKTSRIPVPGDGTGYLYLSTEQDLIDSVIDVAFNKRERKIFYAFPKHLITFLSFARKIQKINPDLGVDFIKPIKERAFNISEGDFLVTDKNFINKIKEIDFTQKKNNSDIKPIKKGKREKIKVENKNKPKRMFVLLFTFMLLIFLMPLFSTMVLSFSAISALSSTKNALVKGDIESARSSAITSIEMFKQAGKSVAVLNKEAEVFGMGYLILGISTKIDKGEQGAQALLQVIDASNTMRSIFLGESKNPENDLSKAINGIKAATTVFQKEKAEENETIESLEGVNPLFNLISNTLDIWPELLGFPEKKNYLVLFQNNMELRPGGGFIGSFGFLTLNKGKVESFKIDDVYSADGQLKAHIEPPFPIRRYLPSEHLYLRDSNFAVNFAGVASSAAQLFNLETGKKANGVIAVDVSFVKDLLSATGEVEVLDYKKKVNADNFFILTESQVEKGFFPGSTQKKDFLGALFKSTQSTIMDSDKVDYLNLAKAVSKGLEEKHILLAYESSSIQNLFETNGYSSSTNDDRSNDDLTINDYLGINEANFGVNKANYFIKRGVSINKKILKNGEINSTITISYKNSSPKEVWPGGDYKNYLRLILPESSRLEKIEIDGKEQVTRAAITDFKIYELKSFKNPKELEVLETEEFGKKIIGFLTNVPAGDLKTIKVFLSQKHFDISDSVSLNYSLKYFKQPGTDEYPISLSLEYPDFLKPIKTDFKNEGKKILYGTNIKKDEEFKVDFAKR